MVTGVQLRAPRDCVGAGWGVGTYCLGLGLCCVSCVTPMTEGGGAFDPERGVFSPLSGGLASGYS